MIGKTLGHYEILEPLGAGGMGEVYLGLDPRLDRKVAIKVLPVEFASDPERLARFEQEAKAAAALNHPHIAVVHDIGFQPAGRENGAGGATNDDAAGGQEADAAAGAGTHFMVQEYLEGQSLRERLDKGALPLDKALDLATEVGEALIAAHQAGIVHRDLKPDNIFVTEQGHAKVLDFGLAKLMEITVSSGGSASRSPTMLGTVAGQIMGTAGYMAPEQVNGEEVDNRTDLFAFGCVLYEMVSGRRPFAGTNVHDTLGRIVDKDPEPLSAIDARLPAEVQRMAKKCLAKDPGRRYQSAADLVVDLRALSVDIQGGQAISLDDLSQVGGAPAAEGRTASPRNGTFARPIPLGWAVAASVLVAILAAAGMRSVMTVARPPDQPVMAFDIALPDGMTFTFTGRHAVAISRDGADIALAAGGQIQRRRIGDADAMVPVAGTEFGGRSPFFSPDGTEIGFWHPGAVGGELRKVSISGGLPTVLSAANNPWGATWLDDGTILYGQGPDGILRVSAEGGDPEVVIAVAANEMAHGPQLLPGGDAVLFTLRTGSGSWNDAQVVVGSLTTDDREVLFSGGTDARYLSTGHIVYVRGGSLMVRSFDVTRLEVGAEVSVIEGVAQALADLTGAGHFGVSELGALVYVAGSAARESRMPVVWVRDTAATAIPGDLDNPDGPRLSPDESHIAVTTTGADGVSSVQVQDLTRGLWTLLTTEGDGKFPMWSHDGSSVYFTSNRGSEPAIYRRPIDLSAPAEEVWTVGATAILMATSMSNDGNLLFVTASPSGTRAEGWVVPLDDLRSAESLFDGAGNFGHVQVHPSGKWIAYVREQQAQSDIFVSEFPIGRTTRISAAGGQEPMWSRDGTALFFRDGEQMLVVDIQIEPEFQAAPQRQLDRQFVSRPPMSWVTTGAYDVAGDGRFVTTIALPADASTDGTPGARIVLNWFEELKELVPTGR